MAIRIRLARMGAKKKPFYRMVVTSSESPRDGRFIEILGTYDPNTDPAKINWNPERLKSWLETGARPTETVQSIIQSSGVLKETA